MSIHFQSPRPTNALLVGHDNVITISAPGVTTIACKADSPDATITANNNGAVAGGTATISVNPSAIPSNERHLLLISVWNADNSADHTTALYIVTKTLPFISVDKSFAPPYAIGETPAVENFITLTLTMVGIGGQPVSGYSAKWFVQPSAPRTIVDESGNALNSVSASNFITTTNLNGVSIIRVASTSTTIANFEVSSSDGNIPSLSTELVFTDIANDSSPDKLPQPNLNLKNNTLNLDNSAGNEISITIPQDQHSPAKARVATWINGSIADITDLNNTKTCGI